MPLPASRRDKNNRRSTASHGSPALGAAVFLNRTHDYDFRRHLHDMLEPKTGRK